MSELIEVLSKEEIARSITEVGEVISHDYQGGKLALVGALKGAFIFMADLAREITVPVQIGFLGVSSYGKSAESSGTTTVTKELDLDVTGMDVLVVEDIVDTGLTLRFIVNYLKEKGARSVKVCAFLDKKERRVMDVQVDYACHEILEGFLVGYGLDYAEDYRNLPGIYHLEM
ncbi:hypoxanthine phosphoribosyltransferase [Desulfoluna butyratoxydans]|uniref:Hypoxanthine phosphoribosyltransferase n=1 Tax=Desulfoluna butyratoxydans TaxID=231438 RepID=A0A4U8YJM5_9BACT|nr:hypoxanthine phosphoribosyltransferase [Desulfoluna butyratoxydans]VFQ43534.1 hypoxanthine phosphoribosyl transferase [Desulfoluna butyratoxydans]